MLATEKQVAYIPPPAGAQRLLFLISAGAGHGLPWMQQIGRPPERKRIPVVLAVQEVQTLLFAHGGIERGKLLEYSDASTTMIYVCAEGGGGWDGQPTG